MERACGTGLRKGRPEATSHIGKRETTLGGLISGLILFSTVTTATAFGIVASYWVINGILTALAPEPSRPAVLIASETHASGD